MRSNALDLKKYNTDKIKHDYLRRYDPFLVEYVDRQINLLELGVLNGGSLLLWRDYFPLGDIFGVDMKPPASLKDEERIRVFKGLQQDAGLLDKVALSAPGGFDIIIDDASHIGRYTRAAFWHLFDNHLRPGGLYAIEDWGTGYWEDWPDGRSYDPAHSLHSGHFGWLRRLGLRKGEYFPNHSFGMVGFVKQLVDEQGASGWLRKRQKNREPVRRSKFEWVTITDAIVFVKKRGGSDPTHRA